MSVDLLQLFDAFFDGSVDLEPINRAYIALLPKGGGATPTPSSFRPVSLQNCDVKILCRALTTRLQQQIGGGGVKKKTTEDREITSFREN